MTPDPGLLPFLCSGTTCLRPDAAGGYKKGRVRNPASFVFCV